MLYKDEARQYFDQANRKAFWNKFLNRLQGQGEEELLDFNEISQQLHLRTAIYRGLQEVPLEKIVGSVGRYKDFNGAFLPVSEDMRERWQKVAMLYLDPTSSGAPPVELFKVGDSYFVKDGNHRVSVANQLGLETIEAYVWEYPIPLEGLDENTDIDTLLLEAERRDFLEKTRLDELRPGHSIRLTAPGGYLELLGQIAYYQKALSKIDGRPVSYEDAVTAWYDMIYETTVQLIEQEGLLDLFPDRTPADFFVWTTRHQRELAERYGRRVPLREAAQDISRLSRPSLSRRLFNGAVEMMKRTLAE
ncbi:MAG: hypothetical protein Kow0077_25860 [Anaerolineae bacterium]